MRFYARKFTEKKFFSKKHFEVNFFYKQYTKKKILEIFTSIFKKLRKKSYKKKSVKCRLIHRFQNGKLSVKRLIKLG